MPVGPPPMIMMSNISSAMESSRFHNNFKDESVKTLLGIGNPLYDLKHKGPSNEKNEPQVRFLNSKVQTHNPLGSAALTGIGLVAHQLGGPGHSNASLDADGLAKLA